MSNIKQEVIGHIIKLEGGYVNDPLDSGGETKYGVTVNVARDYGYNGAMIDLPYYLAFEIYSNQYWDKVGADGLPDLVAKEVVDTAVNMGPKTASKFLQRALNLLTDCRLVVDGSVGQMTINAVTQYMNTRGDQHTLCKVLNCLQGAKYVKLAETREKDRKFVYGWFKNRI